MEEVEAPGDSAVGAATGANVATSSAWALSGRAVMLVVNFVATPFTIRLLGPQRYGLWALLVLSLSWATQADLGMGSASTKFGSDYFARRDGPGESAVVWTALGLITLTTGSLAVVIAIFASPIVTGLLNVNGRLAGAGILALRIGCGVFVLQCVAQVVNTPPFVRLRFREYTVVMVAASLVAAVGTPVALVVFGGGVVTAEAVGLATAATWAGGSFLLAYWMLPELWRPRFDRDILRKMLGYGGALTLAGLAGIPLMSGERFFLAHDQSTTVVAYYAVAATIATTLVVIPEQLGGPLLPAFARLGMSGRPGELRSLYDKCFSGMFLLATPIAVLMALVARPFLSLWAGPAYGVHSTVPLLLVLVGVWFLCMEWAPVTYLMSCGRTKAIARLQVAELVPYCVGAWLLTRQWGAVGAALVWSLRFAGDAVMMTLVSRKGTDLPLLPLSERRIRSLLAPAALVVGVLFASTVSNGLVARFAWMVVLGAVYSALVWLGVLTRRERSGLTALASDVLRRGQRPKHSRRLSRSRHAA